MQYRALKVYISETLAVCLHLGDKCGMMMRKETFGKKEGNYYEKAGSTFGRGDDV